MYHPNLARPPIPLIYFITKMMLCGKISGGNLTQLKQRALVSYMAAQRAETNLHPTVYIKSFAERGKCELLQTTKLTMQFHNGCGTLRDGVLQLFVDLLLLERCQAVC